jgi:hypothetical protein
MTVIWLEHRAQYERGLFTTIATDYILRITNIVGALGVNIEFGIRNELMWLIRCAVPIKLGCSLVLESVDVFSWSHEQSRLQLEILVGCEYPYLS